MSLSIGAQALGLLLFLLRLKVLHGLLFENLLSIVLNQLINLILLVLNIDPLVLILLLPNLTILLNVELRLCSVLIKLLPVAVFDKL